MMHGVTGKQSTLTTRTHVNLTAAGQNLGEITFVIGSIADFDIILGCDFLRRYRPQIDWDGDMGLRFPSITSIDQNIPPESLPTRKAITPHGHEMVSAAALLEASRIDGPIGITWWEQDLTTLVSYGFVPTGEDAEIDFEFLEAKDVSNEQPTVVTIPAEYNDFLDVFSEIEADKLPPHSDHDLAIELEPGAKPPQGPLYPKGHKEMEELRKYIQDHLDKGFIRPSKSPARSPVLFVPKKDGGLRLCVDYRGLNKVTIKNRAPLPLIDEQLFLLRNAIIYTKLDLRSAYNLVRIKEGDEWKTAFGTDLGLYEYLVMPFGLANAPAQFQSLINAKFHDILGVFVVVYLDDFLIFSKSEEEHIAHVREVLQRLRDARLFAKLSKCQFHTRHCEFLGYVITPDGISMEPSKIETIRKWPLPDSIQAIQRFLGFANFYRRFIKHFARITRPLTDLVSPHHRFKKFTLPPEAQESFHRLLRAFESADILKHFDYHKETIVETDASDMAIAGILKQRHGDHFLPVAFYSRKMNSAERNYEIHDKELLAVVASLSQWRHMLAGLPSVITIKTDHEALRYFQTQRQISRRQARWALLLAQYDFVIEYRPGTRAGEPDALSRRSDVLPQKGGDPDNFKTVLDPSLFAGMASTQIWTSKATIEESTNQRTMKELSELNLEALCRIFQPSDPKLITLKEATNKDVERREGLLYYKGRLIVPEVHIAQEDTPPDTVMRPDSQFRPLSREHLRYLVMLQCHDGVTAGHPGRDVTIDNAKKYYYWEGMDAWIKDYVASCITCARMKTPRHRPYGLLKPLATPERPWGSVTLDFIEGLPESNGFDSIMVVVDRLTKYAILAPTHKTVTAAQTATLFQQHVIKRFGCPDNLVTDRGRQFISAVWRQFAKAMGAQHFCSTAYHPQTDGQTERVNQVLEHYLRAYCNYGQNNWADLLHMAEFVYNNAVHTTIGVSPFFACYGWHPKAHIETPCKLGVNDPSSTEFSREHQALVEYLQDRIRQSHSRTIRYYNNKHRDMEFSVGDLVLVNRKNWRTTRPSQKLDAKFSGPYKIIERIGQRAYRLRLPPHLKVHDVFHVSNLQPWHASALADRPDHTGTEEIIEGEVYFEVERIVDKRGSGPNLQYKVAWKGYGEDQDTWEPVNHLKCDDLVAEFENRLRKTNLDSKTPNASRLPNSKGKPLTTKNKK
jgi:transposase InsO family protein